MNDDFQFRDFLNDIPPLMQHHHHHHSQHTLAPLCNPQTDIICLSIEDQGDKADRILSPLGNAVYVVDYRTKGYDGRVQRDGSLVGSWKEHTFRHEKLAFTFPWRKWGFHPDKDRWLSDAGLLPGHEFQWVTVDRVNGSSRQVSFQLKCVDMTDTQRREACQVVMETYKKGRITIPLQVIGSWEQLDELVVVALAAMDRIRDNALSDSDSSDSEDEQVFVQIATENSGL